MAIKGKGKARSRRVIAAPPRPQLVIRKPPIWRRPWVWATVAVVAVAGTLLGVYLSVHHAHVRAFRQRQRAAIAAFSTRIANAFPKDSSIIFPDLPNLFPDLTTDLTGLQQGKLAEADALSVGGKVAAQSALSAARLQAIRIARIIPLSAIETGTPLKGEGGMRRTLSDARFLMVEGMQLYGQVGQLLKSAAPLSAAQQNAIGSEAQAILNHASDVFNEGFKKFEAVRKALGYTSFTVPTQQNTPAPSPSLPVPSLSPSSAPSASPSASASP